jgi:hypothetical protein
MVTASGSDLAPIDGAYQVYPPLSNTDGLEPLPVLDANGQPPGGSIPTIIDPNAPIPAPTDPLKVDPIPDLTPSPPVTTPEAAPAAPKEEATAVKEEAAEKVEEKAEEKPVEEKPAE